jgi:hypothetical protein
MNYIIIEGYIRSVFENEVNKKIGEGWICQGGVSISFNLTRSYCQAMVKEFK